ncbi:hypothetical protein GGI23_001828 [Coemansia sp. RSA 2559]|nr:hypothetical protein GGI23_001828 [Coemansia sp. RSA 2559]
MGLREKADFNLQAITLFVALLTVLFLWAARHYTSDWRERRVFRKHLVKTQSRLKHDNEAKDKRKGRRHWKRFVAALPFMPLATAYVGVRVAWDLFELLVFCTIDGTRGAASKAAQSAYALVVFAYTRAVRLLAELDVKRRAQDALIAVIENTVVWLFGTVFPAVGALGDRGAQQCHVFACWWAERGGPWLRDAIECLVLDGMVPAYGWCSSTLQSAYAKALWLGARCVQAATILANDLICDIAIAYACAASAASWLTSHQRWWFNSRLLHLIACFIIPSAERLEKIRRILLHDILPRCLLAIWQAHTHILLPFGRHMAMYGDQAIQVALGAGTHIYKGLLLAKPVLIELLELLPRVDFYAPVVSICVWLSKHVVAVVIFQSPAHAWRLFCAWIQQSSWMVNLLWGAYARLRDELLVPVVHVLSRGCVLIWQKIVCGSVSMAAWRWLRVSAWPIVSTMLVHCLHQTQHVLAVLSNNIKDVLYAQGILFRKWYSYSSEFSGAAFCQVYNTIGTATRWLQTNIVRMMAIVWPLVCRGVDEGVLAMRDVYKQLIVVMDGAVAMVGDLVVEFARSRAVHNTAESDASYTKGGG